MMTVLAMAVLALGNGVKGLTGFGGPLLAIPVMSLWMPTSEAMVLAVLTDLGTGVFLGWDAIGRVPWRIVAALVLPILVGQWIGTEVLASLDVPTVRVLLAIVVGGFAVGVLVRPVQARASHDDRLATSPTALGAAVVAGLAGGLMSGVVGPGGPPIVAWTRRWLSDASARATLLAVFPLTSIWLVALLVGKGLAPPETVRQAALLTPAALAGAWVGRRFVGRVSPVLFGRVVGLALLAAAVGLLRG